MRILPVMALLLTACAPEIVPWAPTPAFFSSIGVLQATAGWYGTAFPVAHTEDGFVVMTCAHVVEGDIRFTFLLPGEQPFTGGTVLWKSPGRVDWGATGADCALVRFRTSRRPSLYKISQGRGEALTDAWVAGWPAGTDKLQINKAIFQPNRRRLDGSVAPGSSGSPVFNAQGEVVGLISMIWRPSTARGMPVNWSWIIQMSDVRLAGRQL